MNGREKSHPAVIAMKPTNKAEQSAAEPVERRAGTKGKADQQSTLRTQSRVRVTQALDRIRQVAQQRKKEKFTALLHNINVDTLRVAFYALRRKAASGVDGVTWQDYEAHLEPGSRICTGEFSEEPIDHSHLAGRTYRRRTAN
jgi:RNA-directed DNA polymerase